MRISGFGKLTALILGTSALMARAQSPMDSPPQPAPANPANEAPANAAPAKPIVTLRIVGSIVKNHKGEVLGRIDNVVLNPDSGQIDFAMVLVNYPQNTTRTTPVPWFLLRYVTDQGQSGGVPGAQQVFQLNIERINLVRAPLLDKSQWGLLGQSEWRHNVYGYYGFYPTVGANAPAAETAMPETGVAAPPSQVFVEGSSSASASSSFSENFGTDFFDNPGPFTGGGWDGGFDMRNRSTIPDNFPALFPGGDPVIPNNPGGNIFAASTNFFPGAPARLPKDNKNLKIPFGTKLVPNNPGSSPFTVLVPPGARKLVPVSPGQPYSVLVPANATPLVPLNPGKPFSVLVPKNAAQVQALNPGSPFSVTVPAGTTTGGNQGSAWSPIVPQGSTGGNTANTGPPFTIAGNSGGNAPRMPGSAWSPIVPSAPTVSTPPPMTPMDNGGMDGGMSMHGNSPFGMPHGFPGPRFGGGGPPRSGIGLAPLAPLAPLARTGRR